MIIDSSIWIDYFRGVDNRPTERLHQLRSDEPLAIGDLILAEVLQGFSDKKVFNEAHRLLSWLTVIDLGAEQIAVQAARNFLALRAASRFVRPSAQPSLPDALKASTLCCITTETSIHSSIILACLLLERSVDVPKELIWRVWTVPEHLKRWFTPAPWKTIDCEIDLRPGGIFRTVMQSPDGQTFPNAGCYLEVIENERLIWTNAVAPGFRPDELPAGSSPTSFHFTAVISLQSQGNETKYSALVMHANAAARKQHEEMGFYTGWGAALDQLIALARTM